MWLFEEKVRRGTRHRAILGRRRGGYGQDDQRPAKRPGKRPSKQGEAASHRLDPPWHSATLGRRAKGKGRASGSGRNALTCPPVFVTKRQQSVPCEGRAKRRAPLQGCRRALQGCHRGYAWLRCTSCSFSSPPVPAGLSIQL